MMDNAEFARKVMSDTGENIHQIKLTVAMNWYWTHKVAAYDAWAAAQEFMRAMKLVYEEQEHYDRQRDKNTQDIAPKSLG